MTRHAEYRTNVIASASTLAAVRTAAFSARPLGLVQVKGRAEPVEIFAMAVGDRVPVAV